MGDSFSQEERRSSVRSEICIDYSLFIGDHVFKGVTGNMSLGGVCLQEVDPVMSESFTSATGMLTLEIPETPINVDCMIVYVGAIDSPFPSGAGVAFSNPDEEALSIIRRCLTQLS